MGLLTSCGVGHGNFNRQKYTSLKKVKTEETIVEETDISVVDSRVEELKEMYQEEEVSSAFSVVDQEEDQFLFENSVLPQTEVLTDNEPEVPKLEQETNQSVTYLLEDEETDEDAEVEKAYKITMMTFFPALIMLTGQAMFFVLWAGDDIFYGGGFAIGDFICGLFAFCLFGATLINSIRLKKKLQKSGRKSRSWVGWMIMSIVFMAVFGPNVLYAFVVLTSKFW